MQLLSYQYILMSTTLNEKDVTNNLRICFASSSMAPPLCNVLWPVFNLVYRSEMWPPGVNPAPRREVITGGVWTLSSPLHFTKCRDYSNLVCMKGWTFPLGIKAKPMNTGVTFDHFVVKILTIFTKTNNVIIKLL
jgi:hypothetical protein